MSGLYGYGRERVKRLRGYLAGLYGSARALVVRTSTEEKPKVPKGEVVIAIKDYTAEQAGQAKMPNVTSFSKDDVFYLSKKATTDTNWWNLYKHDGKSKKKAVFAPSNCLLKKCDLPDYELISFNTGRNKAEYLLSSDDLEIGSFIIRADTSNFNCPNLVLKLSVKVIPVNGKSKTAHFKILKEGKEYRVESAKLSFKSLSDMVEHYADRRSVTNISLRYSVMKKESVILWDHKNRQVEIGERLGKGFFGEVHKGTIFGDEVVAVKTPYLHRMTAEEFLEESNIARPYKHEHVLETIGVCTKRNYIFTEFMVNGNLKTYFDKHVLTAEECLSIATKIACGMEYLASMSIVHRDLAARNILVGESINVIKISDFGLARSLLGSKYYISHREAFPMRWTAPEGIVLFQNGIMLSKEGKIEFAVDVWSFAVVLWELYTNGKEPYEGIDNNDLYEALTKEENPVRLQQPEKCPDEVYAMMLECWKIDKYVRPTFTKLHAFFSELSGEEPVGDAAAAAAANPGSVRATSSETESESAVVFELDNEAHEAKVGCSAEPVLANAIVHNEYNEIDDENDEHLDDGEQEIDDQTCGTRDSPPAAVQPLRLPNNLQERVVQQDDRPFERPTAFNLNLPFN